MTDRYRISFSTMPLTGKLPQGDRRWAEFNDSFENLTLSPVEIANLIYKGYAFTTWHDGRRSIEHFISGQHIGVDLDTGDERSTFDALMTHEWVRMYASIIYTTPSHTPEAPRARVIFLLDKPIDSAAGYSEAAKFVISQFDGADVTCSDASRFFYGSLNCDLLLPSNRLPLTHLRHYYNAWKQTQPRVAQAAAPAERKAETSSLFERLLTEMAMAREGTRNHTLNRVAFLAGSWLPRVVLPTRTQKAD